MTKVIIAVGGRFHAFELARALQKRGFLKKIITTIPRFALRLKGENIDYDKVKTFPAVELAERMLSRIVRSDAVDYWKIRLFDNFVSSNIRDCDVFIGWAGVCCLSIKEARQKGVISILDRACPHILDQAEIIEEEASRLGIKYSIDRRKIERMVAEYELAEQIVVPSEYSRRSFLSRGFDKNKIKLARLSGKFPAPLKLARNEDDNVFKVLYLGGNYLRKGLIYLLRAWNELKLGNAELLLRTSDNLNNIHLRRLLENPTIKVLKYHSDLTGVYSSSSIFCLPSVDDGFGMAVLEAMSFRLPVIITENVGAADCVRDGIDGFIVKIRDVEALQEKILELYENRDKCQLMGEKAKEQASNFTWDAYGDAYVKIILDALDKKY